MRVIIAEDSVLLREGLTQILARFQHTVVAAVGDAPSLLAAVAEQRPNAVVADIRMPPGFRDEGLRAVIEMRRQWPSLPALVLSQYVEVDSAEELIATGGGVGYLLKDRIGDVAEFVEALQRVAAGSTVIDPEVVRQLLGHRRSIEPLGLLTTREREVLALMAEGLSNSAIASRLVVTEATVLKHVGNIFGKLNLEPANDDHRRVRAVLAYLRAL